MADLKKLLVALFFLFFFEPVLFSQNKDNINLNWSIILANNIYLWPVLYKKQEPLNKEVQALFSLFRNYNYRFKNDNKISSRFSTLYSYKKENHKNSKESEIKIFTILFLNAFKIHTYKKKYEYTYNSHFTYNETERHFLNLFPSFSLLSIKKDESHYINANKNKKPVTTNSRTNFLFLFHQFQQKQNWYSDSLKKNLTSITTVKKFNIFPILWNQKETITNKKEINITQKKITLFPIFWSENTSDFNHNILFPLYWQFKDFTYESISLPPFFSYGKSYNNKRSHLSITPLFHQSKNHQSSFNVLFPLYWKFKDTAYKSITLPPFFSYGKSSDSNFSHLIVTPLFYHFKNYENSSNILFPIFWSIYTKKNQNYHFAIIPLYYHYYNNSLNKTIDILLPIFFRYKTSYTTFNSLFPIYWGKRDGGFFSGIFPIVWQNSRSFVVFPILWKHLNGFHLFPILRYTNNNYFKKFTLLLGSYYHYKDKKKNDFTTRLLYLLYINKKQGKHKEFVIFPFSSHEVDEDGNEDKSYFFGIFSKTKRKVINANEYYKEVTLFWKLRIGSNFESLKNKNIIQSKQDITKNINDYK